MLLRDWAFVFFALMVFTQGCSFSSPNSNLPKTQNPARQTAPPLPQPPTAKRGTTPNGQWVTICHKTKDESFDARSLAWSIEVSGRQVKQTEYNFKDDLYKKLVAFKTRVAESDLVATSDGSDAKIS